MAEKIYFEKLERALAGRVAIFIDAANLEQSVRSMWVNPKDIPDDLRRYSSDELRWRVDYDKLANFFGRIADLKRVKFYSADFETDTHGRFLGFLKKALRFHLETKPLKEYHDHSEEHPHRKANFDVEIAVDAVFTLPAFDTFVLFSGDSDFAYLLKFLRGQNKVAVVFSRSGHVAKELPPASSYYFDITDFRQEILRIMPKKAKNPA